MSEDMRPLPSADIGENRPYSEGDLSWIRGKTTRGASVMLPSDRVLATLDALQDALTEVAGLWFASIAKNAEKRCDLICAQQEEGIQANVPASPASHKEGE
jgi:hypothetical protein